MPPAPAPPPPPGIDVDMPRRVSRLEASVSRVESGRDLNGLTAQVATVENRVHVQERLREGLYDSMFEMASALMRMQRQVDALIRDNQELFRRMQDLEGRAIAAQAAELDDA
jgi:uncharacterized coiled-coil protein SlyX